MTDAGLDILDGDIGIALSLPRACQRFTLCAQPPHRDFITNNLQRPLSSSVT